MKWRGAEGKGTPSADAGAMLRRLVVIAVLGLIAPWAGAQGGAPPQAPVFVIAIEGTIDLGLAPFVRRVLDEAARAKASHVILDIDTFGGRVDAAVAIRDALLAARIETVAFVDKRAISAGALIALACHRLAMSDASTIGAATPVRMGGPGQGTQPVEEKTVSYLRKEFGATAQARGRPALVAEAMVDADVAIADLVEKGKLLTLTTSEAIDAKLAEFRADTLDALLDRLSVAQAEVRRITPNWAEQVVRALTHPIVSSLLLTVGMLGILIELRTPGFGLPGALGLGSIAAFFWGHWLVQLAGWEELLLFTAGVLLLAAEVFVVPGFGIVGALGIGAILGGLILAMLGAGVTWSFAGAIVARVVFALLAALAASLVALRFLPRLPFGRQLILQTELGPGAGASSEEHGAGGWIGRRGRAVSTLRPAGTADFDGERREVFADAGWIAPDTAIEVIRTEGPRLVVRRLDGV